MTLLQCHDLSLGYQGWLIQQLNIVLSAADTLVITGPSGVGKTTLLNYWSRLQLPQALKVTGKYQLNTDQIGFVFQGHDQLLPWKCVLDNVCLPRYGQAKRTLSKEQAAARAQHLLEEVGLAAWQQHYPHQLSGGMKQRVAFARALLHAPQIIFMDEPFAGVDAPQAYRLIELLNQLQRHHGFAIVIVTHHEGYAAKMAGKQLLLTPNGHRFVDRQ